jgi:hypothetical protein
MDEDGTFVAQICHIEAAAPGGERFNSNMTDEERRAFSNLILFCYPHHQVTNDVRRYDVATLKTMKAAHERQFTRPDQTMLTKLEKAKWYTLFGAGTATGLSVEGAAEKIRAAFDALVRPADQPGVKSKTLTEELLSVLRYGPKGTVHVYSREPMHIFFGEFLIEIFRQSGWYINCLDDFEFNKDGFVPDFDKSMLMMFTVRDPHQRSNAEATVKEFFNICGFVYRSAPNAAVGTKVGQSLTFYTPVGVR